jgi:hypothetical protein
MPSRAKVALYGVDDTTLLANEALALAAGSLGVLLCEGRDRRHLAVVPLAAQPAEKGAFQLLGVEPVGLGSTALPRHRNARSVNDVRLDPMCSQPARQPEAVPAGLEGDGDTLNFVAGLVRFIPPSIEQTQ